VIAITLGARHFFLSLGEVFVISSEKSQEMDRKFLGKKARLFNYQGVPFIIRIKQNSIGEGIWQGYSAPVATFFDWIST
jgi:hypothetical protein